MDEYVELMNNLKLANPKMMDVAVPANMKVGLHQEEIARRGWAVTAAQALGLLGKPDVALIDLRERTERERHGIIPGSLHVPYPSLQENIGAGGMLHELARVDQQAAVVLLRLRRALGDGGAGRAGRRACQRLPHPGRHRRLEEGQRAAGALNGVGHRRTPLRLAGRVALASSMQNLAEEQLGPLVLRIVEERLRRVHLDDLALVHEDDAVRRPGAQSPSRG